MPSNTTDINSHSGLGYLVAIIPTRSHTFLSDISHKFRDRIASSLIEGNSYQGMDCELTDTFESLHYGPAFPAEMEKEFENMKSRLPSYCEYKDEVPEHIFGKPLHERLSDALAVHQYFLENDLKSKIIYIHDDLDEHSTAYHSGNKFYWMGYDVTEGANGQSLIANGIYKAPHLFKSFTSRINTYGLLSILSDADEYAKAYVEIADDKVLEILGTPPMIMNLSVMDSSD